MQPRYRGVCNGHIDDLAGVEETTQHNAAQHNAAQHNATTLFLYLSYPALSCLILDRKILFLNLEITVKSVNLFHSER